MDREDIKMLVDKWWDIYNDESLDYRNSGAANAAVPAEQVKLQALLRALSEAGAVRHVRAPSAA